MEKHFDPLTPLCDSIVAGCYCILGGCILSPVMALFFG